MYQFSIAAIPNDHKFSDLKPQRYLLFHNSVGQKNQHRLGQVMLYTRFHKAEIKVTAGLQSSLEALGMNPLPTSFRLLAKFSFMQLQDCSPCFFVAVGQGLFSTFTSQPHSFTNGLLSSSAKPAIVDQVLSKL